MVAVMTMSEATERPADSPEAPTESEALYPGDNGELPEMARRVLVQMLIGPSLESARHPRLWPALIQHQTVIRSRLADLFLDLVMDPERGVAFTRQADTGELETPILLRRSPLTFLDSVLLLYLRGLLSDADARGERAVVSGTDMAEQLKLYERSQSTDRAGFEKRIKAAIEKAKRNNIINPIRGSDDRYLLSASLKLMFGAEEVTALAQLYKGYQNRAEEEV
jgi:hypothetical protein